MLVGECAEGARVGGNTIFGNQQVDAFIFLNILPCQTVASEVVVDALWLQSCFEPVSRQWKGVVLLFDPRRGEVKLARR